MRRFIFLNVYVPLDLLMGGGRSPLSVIMVFFNVTIRIPESVCVQISEWAQRLIPETGEMEHTLAKAFCRTGNLKTLLMHGNTPDVVKEFQVLFSTYFGSAFSGSQHSDITVLNNTTHGNGYVPAMTEKPDQLAVLSIETYQDLISCLNKELSPPRYCSQLLPHRDMWMVDPRVQDKKTVTVNGVTFACVSKHVGNSRILFSIVGDELQHAGEIQRIFIHQRRAIGLDTEFVMETFFVIRQFQALDDMQAAHDPYRRFPGLPCRLFSTQFMHGDRVIRAQNIVSHFAGCPYQMPELSGQFLVVLSLNRVSVLGVVLTTG